MGMIQCLDPHVADLIAAGEVVERPGAVVKEWLENAIDAGATAVTVELARGGMQMIRVTDNGSGIEQEDVKTAFLRHATSKIRTEHDLEAIGTLGFRGEALAAISAVSRVTIRTRTAKAESGSALQVDGGEAGAVRPVGMPQGTTIVVRDLFYNTPARQKFVKKDAAEGAYAYSLVQKIALSHPEISICFIRDGKEEMRTPGDGVLHSAIYAVLGRDLALNLCPVHAAWEDCVVDGFVSQPSACKGTRAQQHFFVNGRFVKSRLMMAALEEAYRNQAMVGKFPACVLHIAINPADVDVNVHPTKTEVKFVRERRLFDAVHHSVLNALEAGNVPPKMQFAKPAQSSESEQPAVKNQHASGLSALFEADNQQERPTGRAPQKAEGPLSYVQPVSDRMLERGQWGHVEDSARAPYAASKPQTDWRPGTEQREMVENSFLPPFETPVRPAETQSAETEMPSFVEQEREVKRELQTEVHVQTPFQLVGEVFDTYLIVTVGQKMLVIDKHAAHERMHFDRLKAEGYEAMSQTLLKPIILAIREEAGSVLLDQMDLLTEFGFDVDTFGDNSLIVRAVPFDLEPSQAEDTLLELAETLLHGRRAAPQSVRDQMLRTMACKLAIKGGQKQTMQELMVVAAAVVQGQVKTCPHGRPVAIELTRQELEKQFKRS